MAGGQGFTASAGNVGLAITLALVGSAIAVSQGVVSANNDGTVALTGQAITAQQQTIAPSWGQALSGSGFTSNAGSLSIILRPTDPVGLSVSTSAGTLTAQGSGVTANLSGVEITSAQGDVTGGTQFLGGIAIASAQGAVGINLSLPITGIESTVSQGTVAPAQEADDTYITSSSGTTTPSMDVALVGSAITASQGTLTVTGDVTLALTGSEITSAAGTLIYDKQQPLTGVEITAQQQSMGAPGGASLTGLSITTTAGDLFTTNDRTFALTGLGITASDGIVFASALAFVTGQELTISAQEIGPRAVYLVGLSISAGTGNVSVLGAPKGAGRKHHRRYEVEIDGEVVEVESEDEALHVLESLKEKAESEAKLAVERAVKAEKKPVRKILQDARKSLVVPEIDVSESLSDNAANIKAEIEDIYKSALQTIEIAALMRKQAEDEEEALLMTML